MSYVGLLTQRCDVLRLNASNTDGAASYSWVVVASSIRVRTDLSYIRPTDPNLGWIPEAGRPDDRVGTAFFLPDAIVRPGDRIRITRGPTGTFEVKGSLDTVIGRQGYTHHIEARIEEVAKALGDS